MMATAKLEFTGYFFGVETDGEVTAYPDYDLAVSGLRYRRAVQAHRKHKLKMEARYTTGWFDANEPPNGEWENMRTDRWAQREMPND